MWLRKAILFVIALIFLLGVAFFVVMDRDCELGVSALRRSGKVYLPDERLLRDVPETYHCPVHGAIPTSSGGIYECGGGVYCAYCLRDVLDKYLGRLND